MSDIKTLCIDNECLNVADYGERYITAGSGRPWVADYNPVLSAIVPLDGTYVVVCQYQVREGTSTGNRFIDAQLRLNGVGQFFNVDYLPGEKYTDLQLTGVLRCKKDDVLTFRFLSNISSSADGRIAIHLVRVGGGRATP